ncbi:unnamed protein product, partial [Effrenium voratum]
MQPGLLEGPKNSAAFSAAISSCERAARWIEALAVLRRMGPTDRLPAHNAAISACEKAGLWEVAIDLLNQLWTQQLTPSGVSYNAAISACQREGHWQAALRLLFERRCVAEVDEAALGGVVSTASKAVLWELCLALVLMPEVVAARPSLVDASCISAALLACQRCSQWSRALEIFEARHHLPEPADVLFAAMACEEVGRLGHARCLRLSAWRAPARTAFDVVLAAEITESRMLQGRFWRSAFRPALRELCRGMGSSQMLSGLASLGVRGGRHALVTLGA